MLSTLNVLHTFSAVICYCKKAVPLHSRVTAIFFSINLLISLYLLIVR
jgi:hypothetical protein